MRFRVKSSQKNETVNKNEIRKHKKKLIFLKTLIGAQCLENVLEIKLFI